MYEVFEDTAGGFRWRLKAKNGEIVAQSESYTTRENAERGAKDAQAASREPANDNGNGDATDAA